MKLGLFAVKELLLLKSRKQKCLRTIAAAFVFIIILNSCSNNSVTPEEDKPGRRDYEWTVDTFYLFNSMYRIWGSSPSDVWAINGDGFYHNIYHFDGNRWSSDGEHRALIPHSIWGSSGSNIFIGGSDGMIWHYDGNIWQEMAVLTKDENDDIVFDNMWGDSPNNVFAFGAYPDENLLGNNSVIAHYTKNKWNILNTDGLKGIVERLYKNKSDQNYYFRLVNIGGGKYYDSTCIYEQYLGSFREIYSSVESKGTQADISLINDEVYFILGNRIARRVNNQFQTFLEVGNPNFYQRIWGRNSKDIFLFMTDGLAHYNGTDYEYLLHFNKPRTHIFGASIFEDEVFFLVIDSSNLSLIYHGKLKKGEESL